MKRYFLFANTYYYPAGGMYDFIGSYDTIEQSRTNVIEKARSDGWYHIYDSEEMEVIEEGDVGTSEILKRHKNNG